MRRIDLDHNATTPVEPEVAEAMVRALRDLPGNPSSLHEAGRRARDAVEVARAAVARLVGGRPAEIVFTSGGTEANHLALSGVPRGPGGALVVSSIEHASVLAVAGASESAGVRVVRIDPAESGAVAADAVLRAIPAGPAVVSLMLANNETGVLQPVAAVARALDRGRVRLHTDAVQAAGKLPVDAPGLGVDYATISAHKLGGPKGAGALWARGGDFPPGILHGGGQEHGVRPGTENVPAIVGFGRAAELAIARLDRARVEMARLRDLLEVRIIADTPDAVRIGAGAPRVPSTACIAFPGIEGTVLVELLDLKGVAASTGAACESGSTDHSHVLRAMRVPDAVARGAVRFSLGPRTTEAEIRDAAGRIAEAVADLAGR